MITTPKEVEKRITPDNKTIYRKTVTDKFKFVNGEVVKDRTEISFTKFSREERRYMWARGMTEDIFKTLKLLTEKEADKLEEEMIAQAS